MSAFAEVSIDGEKPHVPWFPRTLPEINDVGKHLLDRPDESAQSHPYFKDIEYRKRRDMFNEVAQSWTITDPIPHIDYTQDDLKAWSYIYRNIKPLHQQYFCKKFNENFAKLEKYCKLGENNICQLGAISEYLQKETGFRLKPVHGILSQREFLNALAHRVFCCTQYIRHHENPEYTPEPDMIHEVMGHMSLLSDPEFADLSQKIGLVSLGQSDENIAKIGALYLYTIEFGSIKEGEDVKCYGAGIASCIDEIKNFVQNKEKRRRLNPTKDLPLNYPIQTVQDVFFVADNLSHATESLLSYSRGLRRPFLAWYDYSKKEVVVDKSVKMIH
jgi:phenylalanine-4-hydroxylase